MPWVRFVGDDAPSHPHPPPRSGGFRPIDEGPVRALFNPYGARSVLIGHSLSILLSASTDALVVPFSKSEHRASWRFHHRKRRRAGLGPQRPRRERS
jgi:hypothetical protein